MKEFKKIEEYESVLYSFNSSSEQGRYGLEEMCISEFGEENFKKEFNICDGKGDDGVDAYGRLKEGNDTVLYIIQSKTGKNITEADIRLDLSNIYENYKKHSYDGSSLGIAALRDDRQCNKLVILYFTVHDLQGSAKKELEDFADLIKADEKFTTRFDTIDVINISKEFQIKTEINKRRLTGITFKIPNEFKKLPEENYYSGYISCQSLINLLSEIKQVTGTVESAFYQNPRDYLITKINAEIKSTLEREPENFVKHNSGILLIAKKVHVSTDDKYLIFTDMSIGNGGQTTRCIYEFVKNEISKSGLKEEEFFKKNIKKANKIWINIDIMDVSGTSTEEIERIILDRNINNTIKARDMVSGSASLANIRNIIELAGGRQIMNRRGKLVDGPRKTEMDPIKFFRCIDAALNGNIGSSWSKTEVDICNHLPDFERSLEEGYQHYGDDFIKAVTELNYIVDKNKKRFSSISMALNYFMLSEIMHNIFLNLNKENCHNYYTFLYNTLQNSDHMTTLIALCNDVYQDYTFVNPRDEEHVSELIKDGYGSTADSTKTVNGAIKRLNSKNASNLVRLCQKIPNSLIYENKIKQIQLS